MRTQVCVCVCAGAELATVQEYVSQQEVTNGMGQRK
jgi:hypothetical protein